MSAATKPGGKVARLRTLADREQDRPTAPAKGVSPTEVDGLKTLKLTSSVP